jgi:hypothetical protein
LFAFAARCGSGLKAQSFHSRNRKPVGGGRAATGKSSGLFS